MKKYVIIAAGGSGVRMGNATPKQFLQLRGKSILWHSVKAFTDAFADIHVVVVAPALHLDEAREVCSVFNNVQVVEGGTSRFQSVKNGLNLVQDEAIVFVHDAVRCLVTNGLIQKCYHKALETGSAIPSVAVSDSVRMVEGKFHKVINRDMVRIVQTPQTFKSEIILNAFSVEDNDRFTDEATVVEASGREVYLIEGEYTNIKITRPIDILIAEKILEERSLLQQS